MFLQGTKGLIQQRLSHLYRPIQQLKADPCRYSHSIAALKKAIQQRNLNKARIVYEDIQNPSAVDKESLRNLILLARNGRQRKDIQFLQQIIQDMPHKLGMTPRHFEYHALMYAYGLQKQTNKAFEVYQEMQQIGLKPTLHTYNTLLSCYKRVNDLHNSLQLIEDMKKQGIHPDSGTYNTLLHMYSKEKDYRSAYDIYQTMHKENIKPDIFTYCTLLDIAIKSNHSQLGNEVYEMLMKYAPKDMDIQSVNMILRYKAMINYEEAMSMYRHLSTTHPHIRPDRFTYNTMIDLCLKHTPSDALEVLQDMKDAHVQPDIVTYGTLMDAEARKGNVSGCLDLFKDMSVYPNQRILNILLNTSKHANKDELHELVSIIEHHPDILLDTHAYNALLYGLAQKGCSTEAQKIYDSVFRKMTPDIITFTHLVLSYINNNQLEDALDIYTTLREHHKKSRDHVTRIPLQLDTVFYSTLISSLTQTPSHPSLMTALSIFSDMRTLHIQPSTHNYTALLHACGQCKDSYVLKHIHQLINTDFYLDPDTGLFNALMDAYNRIGDGHTVLDIWQSMSHDSVSILSPDATSVSIVFDSCGHNGMVFQANYIWTQLKQNHFPLNTNNYNSYLECLCRSYGHSGWYKALHILQTEMSMPHQQQNKPLINHKTINTLTSFGRKKGIPSSDIASLEDMKKYL